MSQNGAFGFRQCPGDVAILESVVDMRRGRELSTVVVWQLLAEEENCLRSSPGSCLPKKRTVFWRRLAVACRRRELSSVVVWQLLAEEENCLRSSSGSCLPKKRTFVGHWTVGELTLNYQFNLKCFFVD